MYVYCSENGKVIRIDAYTEKVIGKLESIGRDRVVIDGKVYETTEYFSKHRSEMPYVNVGDVACFLFNGDGKVVRGIKAENGVGEKLFCILVKSDAGKGFERPCIRLYDETGAYKTLYFAEKTFVDGRKMSTDVLKSEIKNNYSAYCQKAAFYKVNSDNEIVYLDTEMYNSGNEDEASLQRIDIGTASVRSGGRGLYSGQKMVLPLDTSAKALIVPLDEGKVANYQEYSYMFSSTKTGTVIPVGKAVSLDEYMFYSGDEVGCPQYVVRLEDIDYLDGLAPVKSATASHLIVTEVFNVYDSNTEETLTALSGIVLQSGLASTLYLAPELTQMYDLNKIYSEKSGWLDVYKNINEDAVDDTEGYLCQVSDIKVGDIIRYQTSNSRVTKIDCIFKSQDNFKNGLEVSLGNNNGTVESWFRLLSGSVEWIKGDKFGMNTMGTTEILDYTLLNGVIVCDGDRVDIYKATMVGCVRYFL